MQRILLATDFGPASRAAEDLAADLAGELGVACLVLHVIESVGSQDDPELRAFYQSLERRGGEQLAMTMTRLEMHGVECRGLVAIGRRWEVIIRTAENEHCDLIVMGSQEPIQDGRPRVGTTSHKVFFASPVPLLVVPCKVGGEEPALEESSQSRS